MPAARSARDAPAATETWQDAHKANASRRGRGTGGQRPTSEPPEDRDPPSSPAGQDKGFALQHFLITFCEGNRSLSRDGRAYRGETLVAITVSQWAGVPWLGAIRAIRRR